MTKDKQRVSGRAGKFAQLSGVPGPRQAGRMHRAPCHWDNMEKLEVWGHKERTVIGGCYAGKANVITAGGED